MIFIAELCQNHNGNFDTVKKMAYEAREAGADYAKIQTIFADMVTYRQKFENGVVKNGIEEVIKRPYKDECERLKGLEISYDQQRMFIEYCHEIGIKPLTTAFTRDSVSKIHEIGFKDIKIASYDCPSSFLLNDVKSIFNKIFVSTGASFDDEIEQAGKILSGRDFYMLHCVTMYPTPLDQFHLSRMELLKKYTPNVGWSDHSLVSENGIKGTLASIYYGAVVVERHMTILPESETKDGKVSIKPEHIKQIKSFARLSKDDKKSYLKDHFPDYEITFGNINRSLSKEELMNRDYFRGRFSNKDSKGNSYFNWEDINE